MWVFGWVLTTGHSFALRPRGFMPQSCSRAVSSGTNRHWAWASSMSHFMAEKAVGVHLVHSQLQTNVYVTRNLENFPIP